MSTDPARIPFRHPRPLRDPDAVTTARAFHDLMSGRRTVRAFSDRPVPTEVIESCIATAGTAPSGANRQPWFFVVVTDPDLKRSIREAAEAEEEAFYAGRAPEEWLEALRPLGTDASKPFLETAPALIAIFAERWGEVPSGARVKNYYVQESVGIATGILIAALHSAGLSTLTHTPNPMRFLSQLLGRPAREQPFLLLVVGHAAEDATVPDVSRKPLHEIATFH